MDRPLHAVLVLLVAVALAVAATGCRDRASEESTVQFAPFQGTVTEGGATDQAPADGATVAANPDESEPNIAAQPGQDAPAPANSGAASSGQPAARGGSPTAGGGAGAGGSAPSGGAVTERRGPPSGGSGVRQGTGGESGDGDRRGGQGERRSPFERFDANEDGKLTAAEMPEEFRERMMRADTNGDGAVTREEMDAAMRALRESWRGGQGDQGGQGGEGRRRGPFDRFDANDDGVLTTAEVPEEAREHIMRADTNGDGKVTREEWQAAMRAFRERGESGPGGPPGGGRRGGNDD